MIIIKGKKYKFIHTMDITLDDIRAVFFPKNFNEKYKYLGYIPYSNNMDMLKALIIAMDYEAKPKWCPRWFLRFLHLFGSDNSIVRVRNWNLHQLSKKLTKGIMIWDYKTKWSDYDLRISIFAPQYLQDLSDAIESFVYQKGYKKELVKKIKEIEPHFNGNYLPIYELETELERLKKDV
jgi:hypothetical protein